METVILVNKADEPVGRMEKMEAHRLGLLHRAFSVFLINSEGKTCSSSEPQVNTTPPCYGPTPAAATSARENLILRRQKGA